MRAVNDPTTVQASNVHDCIPSCVRIAQAHRCIRVQYERSARRAHERVKHRESGTVLCSGSCMCVHMRIITVTTICIPYCVRNEVHVCCKRQPCMQCMWETSDIGSNGLSVMCVVISFFVCVYEYESV